MNIVRAILLGSAAGLSMMTGAVAADLPMTKAAPVEYVRVCKTYGPGFFYIPGTDTCIRVGGRARFEYQYTAPLKSRNADVSSYRGLGRIQVDARTASEWGAIRTFVRFEIASRTGGWPLRSGSQERLAGAFYGTGIDTFGRAQKFVEVDKAFIQFAGLTAGRFSSFYDFYGHELELIGNSASSEVQSTNGIAYTAKLGNGFSATASIEDPTFRRQPIYTSVSGLTYTGNVATAPVALTYSAITGLPTSYALVDSAQRNNMPDIVGALRYDGSWGSAQLSAAIHQVQLGAFVAGSAVGLPAAAAVPNGALPEAAYGYAIQGGVKLKMDMISPGDTLFLQAAWGRGALSYTGFNALCSQENRTCQSFGQINGLNTYDGYVNSYGDIKLSTAWSVVAAYLHYWTPTVRQGIFGSYAQLDYGAGARSVFGPLYGGYTGYSGTIIPAGGVFTSQTQLNTYAYSPTMKDYNQMYVGTNLIWSPVKDLDIGAEISYAKYSPSGRVVDANQPLNFSVNGVPYVKTTSNDYVWEGRLRVQRDF